MKANKVLAMTLAMAMTAGMLAGCGSSEKEVKETKKVEDSASEGEQITLNYWTWFPIRFRRLLMRLKRKTLTLRST